MCVQWQLRGEAIGSSFQKLNDKERERKRDTDRHTFARMLSGLSGLHPPAAFPKTLCKTMVLCKTMCSTDPQPPATPWTAMTSRTRARERESDTQTDIPWPECCRACCSHSCTLRRASPRDSMLLDVVGHVGAAPSDRVPQETLLRRCCRHLHHMH